MAAVADRDTALVQEGSGGAWTGSPSFAGSAAVSFLPPGETTLERFVRESRLARRQGEMAVHRREDEARLEEAV